MAAGRVDVRRGPAIGSALPERPRIRRHLLAATLGEDGNVLLAEDGVWLWQSPGLAELLRHLDGRSTLLELFERAAPRLTAPEVVYHLNRLQALGVLADGDNSRPELAFWEALGGDAPAVAAGGVRCRAAGPVASAATLAEALDDVLPGAAEGEAVLDVVVADHYFRPELDAANAAAIAGGSAWMACKLGRQTAWIGPIFHPARTGCLACLQDRLRLNRPIEDYVVRKTGDGELYTTSIAASPAMTRIAATWAAHEIALWLAGRSERLEGRLLSLRLGHGGLEVAMHTLVRRPQCRVCGRQRPRPERISLQHRPVASGLRVASPAATLARLEPQISPLTGVVKWLTEVIGDPDGLLHGYSAGHSLSLGPDTLRWLRRSLNAHARGKGATDQEARVSALGEAIERYCGVFHEDVTCRRATYAELGGQAIHPHRCLNFSARQYERREALNAGGADGYLHMVPRPFPEDLELDWVALWSLIDEEVRYLPAALCYYAHRDVERHLYCAGDSSGCAAGTVLEEAVLHAFLELVERDAVAMWWYNQVVRPAVDLDSCGDPYLARVRDRHARDGRELCALDLTSDLGLPVIAAVSRRLDGPAEELLFGFGAHLDPAAALRHAVNEVNQFLPSVARHGPDGRTHYAWHDEAAIRFWRDETLASQPQLGPDRAVRPRRLGELPCVAVTDLYDGLRACLEIVRRKGLDLLVLDQSRADVELAVARVVVPGMRHFWRRLGPGRLYDVPVQLGWLDTPKAEDELNRVSIFF